MISVLRIYFIEANNNRSYFFLFMAHPDVSLDVSWPASVINIIVIVIVIVIKPC